MEPVRAVKDLRQAGAVVVQAVERAVVWGVGVAGEVAAAEAWVVTVRARRAGTGWGMCRARRATRLPAAPVERAW